MKIPKKMILKLASGNELDINFVETAVTDNGRTVTASIKISKELLEGVSKDIEFE